MSLTVASSYNAVTFAQQQGNVGFATAYQGPDTVAYSLNYQVDAFNLNAVYAVETTLTALSSITIDLTNLTDFFNNPLSLSRVYGLQVGTVDADLLIGPAASNGCQWFFNSLTDGIVVKAESSFSYNTTSAFTVTGSSCNITLQNLSATTDLVYKLVIFGGEGPMTTPTPTPTPSPTVTALPTATPVVTTTLIPTPLPT